MVAEGSQPKPEPIKQGSGSVEIGHGHADVIKTQRR